MKKELKGTIEAKFLGVKALQRYGYNYGDFPVFGDIKTGKENTELEEILASPHALIGSDFLTYFGVKNKKDYEELKNRKAIIDYGYEDLSDENNYEIIKYTGSITMKAIDGKTKTFEFETYKNNDISDENSIGDWNEDEFIDKSDMILFSKFITF